jgi:hypothetical protein
MPNIVSAYTKKNEPGVRPYLFGRNDLRDFCSDWRILHYEEALDLASDQEGQQAR